MIKYITSRPLWFNILVALGIIVIIFLIFMFSLNWITRHGDSKTVPSVMGKRIDKVQELLSDAGFELVIQDSTYYDSIPPGTVVFQFPEADQVVKVNRTVFVKISSFVAPPVTMPNISGFRFRNAEMTLNGAGLKVADTISRPDWPPGTVVDVLFEGKQVKPGDKLKYGSGLTLVISTEVMEETAEVVPDLTGMIYEEAKVLLESMGVSLQEPIVDANVTDISTAYVYRQRPEPRTPDGARLLIRSGQMMHVWLSKEKPVTDTLSRNEPPQFP